MPAFPSGLESQWRQWFIFICSLYSQYPVLYLEHNLSTCLPAEVWLHIFLFYPHPCEVKKLKIREVKSELSYHRESNCHVVDSKNFFLFHRSPVFTWQSAWRYFFFYLQELFIPIISLSVPIFTLWPPGSLMKRRHAFQEVITAGDIIRLAEARILFFNLELSSWKHCHLKAISLWY